MALSITTIIGGLIGLLLLVAGIVDVATSGAWNKHLTHLLLAFGGLVAFVFSDEFAEYTGRYGWTRNQWRQYPDSFVKLIGAIAVLVSTNKILQWV